MTLKDLGCTEAYSAPDQSFDGLYTKAILADGSLILIVEYSGVCDDDSGDGPLNG